MVIEKGNAPGDKRPATESLITGDVAICLRHNTNYARDLRQAKQFARNIDNG
jgi:hypothetical protein